MTSIGLFPTPGSLLEAHAHPSRRGPPLPAVHGECGCQLLPGGGALHRGRPAASLSGGGAGAGNLDPGGKSFR